MAVIGGGRRRFAGELEGWEGDITTVLLLLVLVVVVVVVLVLAVAAVTM